MLLNITNLLPILIAGLMNGSFVIPAKYIKNFTSEKIWLCHSIIGLTLIPWAILIYSSPGAFHNYLYLKNDILLFIIFGGMIFGLGQVFFAYAIESIGVALSFTINLGIGVTIGSMFLVFYKTTTFTIQHYFVTIAVILIICSLVIYYFSARTRKSYENFNVHYHTGWLLASLAGFASGLQNIVFVIVAFHTETQFKANHSFWVWPPFLLAAATVMVIGFSFRMIKKQKITQSTPVLLNFKNILLIAVMGACFTGSLALYSDGMSKLADQQKVIGWPIFMVAIILTCQAWGWLYGESKGLAIKSKLYLLCSILLLGIAISILAVAT